ncbi:MAG: hypothetical protein GY826_34765 [Fuerstiella sp.]|nr:hypothetical protein [Fuerstiella sp.]
MTFQSMNVTQSHAKMPDDRFISTHREGVILKADAVTRGCLSGNRYAGMFNLERSFEFNNTADLENNGSGSTSLDGLLKTALDDRFIFVVVLGRRNDKHFAAPASLRERAKTLGFGEGGCFCPG